MIAGVWDPTGREHRGSSALDLMVEPPSTLAERGDVRCALLGTLHDIGDDAGDALLSGWVRWGAALPVRLRGEFVVACWDAAQGFGIVAVDQFATAGLCFARRGSGLVFAPEVRDVLSMLSRRPGPDAAAVAHWLGVSGPPEGRTLYEGVSRLAPGTALVFEGAAWRVERYWRPRYQEALLRDRDQAVEGIREHLGRAVRRRAPADEPVGVMLSGGLDSAAVAGVLRAESGERRSLRSYSAVFPRHPRSDETDLIEAVATQAGYGTFRYPAPASSALAGTLDYLREWELPSSSPNLFFWMPLLERARSDGATALLDGEAGDELFGLSTYLPADRLRRGRVLAAYGLVRRFPGAGRASRRAVLRVLAQYGLRGALPPRLLRSLPKLGGMTRHTPPWFLPDTRRAYLSSEDPWDWMRLDAPRWWAYLIHALTNTAGALMARDHVRLRSALAGVVARHPMLDVDLVEHVLRLDPELAFDPQLSRPLLRDAVDGLIPDAVRWRGAKSSFDAPFHDSLLGPDLGVMRALLLDPAAEVRAFIDQDRLHELFDRPGDAFSLGRGAWALYAWRLATTELWLLSQRDNELPSRVVPEATRIPLDARP